MADPDAWRAYFWPETYNEATHRGVMRNLLGIRDEAQLRDVEYAMSIRQQRVLASQDFPRTFDAAHIKGIHHTLFGEIYEWAGQYRTVGMTKDKTDFASVQQIPRYLVDVQRLVTSHDWRALDRDGFARAAADVYAHLNQAHPFREGNGRTAKVFMQHGAEQSNFTLNYDRANREIWNNASMLSGPDRGKYHPVPDSLMPVFRVIAQPRQPERKLSLQERAENAVKEHRASPRTPPERTHRDRGRER